MNNVRDFRKPMRQQAPYKPNDAYVHHFFRQRPHRAGMLRLCIIFSLFRAIEPKKSEIDAHTQQNRIYRPFSSNMMRYRNILFVLRSSPYLGVKTRRLVDPAARSEDAPQVLTPGQQLSEKFEDRTKMLTKSTHWGVKIAKNNDLFVKCRLKVSIFPSLFFFSPKC
ncbi:hypothetical protein QWJ34_16775 [Saccharibacillus sp. CPCC 101409]|uniref:hypothetical protein n=1 Tax=Saccharibacillus sp. CPCC 101409 TaxID=3058041 RepID=UPI0026722DE4|nr:hypothetical protein [Saccharibacillus sp. CPCC 101409]MDO3411422.1 hypothetical protein [Saccharibacillus sp. CPCC 101409]